MSTKSRFVDELIATARSKGAMAEDRRRALRADDGIDYRRRVLARLTGRSPRDAHPAGAQLWKQANERLDQLGL